MRDGYWGFNHYHPVLSLVNAKTLISIPTLAVFAATVGLASRQSPQPLSVNNPPHVWVKSATPASSLEGKLLYVRPHNEKFDVVLMRHGSAPDTVRGVVMYARDINSCCPDALYDDASRQMRLDCKDKVTEIPGPSQYHK